MLEWLTMQWQSTDWHVIWKTVGQIGLTFGLTTTDGWQALAEEHNTGSPHVSYRRHGHLRILAIWATSRCGGAVARVARNDYGHRIHWRWSDLKDVLTCAKPPASV